MMKTFLQVFVAGVIILALTGCNNGHLRERNPQASDRRFTPVQKQKRPCPSINRQETKRQYSGEQ